MPTDADYQNWADWEEYQKSQAKPSMLGGDNATIQSNDATWPTGTDWIRQGLSAATGDELFNGQGGMPIESLSSDKPTQEPGIRSAASKALEIGSGALGAIGVASTAPESFGTTALAIPAGYTAGELAGHAAGTELGLNAPESVMSKPGDSIYSPKNIGIRYVENAAIPTAFAMADRVANRGVIGALKPWGEATGGIEARNAAAATDAAANDIVRSPGVFLTNKEGLAQSGNKAGNIQSINEADPGVIETGLYGGGSEFDVNPSSETFGKFVPGEGGAVNNSVTSVAGTVRESLPKIAQARDAMVTQYDNAFDVLRQGDPTSISGITPNSVMNVTLDGTPQTKTLGATLQGMIEKEALPGTNDNVAKVLRDTAEEIQNGVLRKGEYKPGEALQTIGVLDKQIDDLNGWKDMNPGQGDIADAKISMLKTARVYWKKAFDSSVAGIDAASQSSPTLSGKIPAAAKIQTLNDAWSSLQPINTQLQHFDAQMQESLASMSMPSRPGPPSTASTNFINPGATGSWQNRAVTKLMSLGYNEQDAINKWRSELIQTDKQGLSNAQGWLKAQGVQVSPIPRANFLQNSLKGVAGAAGIVGTAGVAQAQDFQPAKAPMESPGPLTLSLQPPPPTPKDGFTVPRNLSVLDPQGVANLITGVAAPQDVQPLIFQWQRLVAAGDKARQAQFLGMLSDAHPDFPLARGAVTGLASEFDLGDGKPRLFTPNDKARWEEQIHNSPLSANEKAQRVMALRKDGLVIPFTTRVSPPAQMGSSDYQFGARQQTSMGSRRIDQ